MRLLDLLASFSFSLFFFYFFFVFIPIRLCRRLKGSGGGDGKYRNSRLSARACGSNGPFRFLELAYRIISPLSDSSTAVTWFWWVACLLLLPLSLCCATPSVYLAVALCQPPRPLERQAIRRRRRRRGGGARRLAMRHHTKARTTGWPTVESAIFHFIDSARFDPEIGSSSPPPLTSSSSHTRINGRSNMVLLFPSFLPSVLSRSASLLYTLNQVVAAAAAAAIKTPSSLCFPYFRTKSLRDWIYNRRRI